MSEPTPSESESTLPSVSVLMAYNARAKQLRNTLESLKHWHGSDHDWIEIVLVDDSSEDREESLRILEDFPFRFKWSYSDRKGRHVRNPGILYNGAAADASHEILMLTCPEVLHEMDVLGTIRTDTKDGHYLVFGCRTLKSIPESFSAYLGQPETYVDTSFAQGWYQHSRHRPALLHFCSAITKGDFLKYGGFDPIYDNGAGYEDNDLVEQIVGRRMTIHVIDRPFVAHQWHLRPDNDAMLDILTRRNWELFRLKWGYDPRGFDVHVSAK